MLPIEIPVETETALTRARDFADAHDDAERPGVCALVIAYALFAVAKSIAYGCAQIALAIRERK